MRTTLTTDNLPYSQVQLVDKHLYIYTRESYRIFNIDTGEERTVVMPAKSQFVCRGCITSPYTISGIHDVNDVGVELQLHDYDIITGNLISSVAVNNIPNWYKFSISPRGSIAYDLSEGIIIDLRTGRYIDLDTDDLPTWGSTLKPGAREGTWILRRQNDIYQGKTSAILYEGKKRWLKSITGLAKDITFIDHNSYVYISPEGKLVHNGTSSIDIPKSMNKITITKDPNVVIISGLEKVSVISLNDIGMRTKCASKVL